MYSTGAHGDVFVLRIVYARNLLYLEITNLTATEDQQSPFLRSERVSLSKSEKSKILPRFYYTAAKFRCSALQLLLLTMGQSWQVVNSLLGWLNQSGPDFTQNIICGVILLCFLTWVTKAPPCSNSYLLQDCITSQGPGPQNRPCPICLDDIMTSELSIKHKPCHRAFHSECYLDWIDASIYNLDTPICPLCLKALLTYEQSLQIFLWRFSSRQKRLFWRLYFNAVACGDWLALMVAASFIILLATLLMMAQGLGRSRRYTLTRLHWMVENTLGQISYKLHTHSSAD
jgi:hypothetical protein